MVGEVEFSKEVDGDRRLAFLQDLGVLGPDNARIESKLNSRYLKHVSSLKICSLRIKLFSDANLECPRMAYLRLIR